MDIYREREREGVNEGEAGRQKKNGWIKVCRCEVTYGGDGEGGEAEGEGGDHNVGGLGGGGSQRHGEQAHGQRSNLKNT